MTQKSLTESRETTKPQIAYHESNPAPAPAPSPQGGFYPILQLQKNLGNRNIAKLIQSKQLTPKGQIIGLQRKLTVGAADDQYEKEADQVARQVMNTPDAAVANSMQRDISSEEEKDELLQTKPLAASITPFVQREMAIVDDEDKEEPIQAKSAVSMSGSFEAGDDIENQLSQSKGQGSPLPDSVRSFMEPRFGADFSQVRVHTGNDAVQMNRNVGAQAFTHGSDIYFGEGRSPTNLELTAHELTHVVQQSGGASLQTKKRTENNTFPGLATSLQRKCAACAAEDKEEQISSQIQRLQEHEIQRWWDEEGSEEDEKSWLDEAVDTVSDLGSSAYETVSDTASEAYNAASETASNAYETVSDTASSAYDWASETASDAGEAVSETATEAWNTVGEGVNEAWASASEKANEVVDWGAEAAENIEDTITDTAHEAADWGVETAGEAWDTLMQTFGDPSKAVNSAIGVVQNALNLYYQLASRSGLSVEHREHQTNLEAAHANLTGLLGSENHALILGAVQPILGVAHRLSGLAIHSSHDSSEASINGGIIQRTAIALPLAGAGPVGWAILAVLAILAIAVLISTSKPCPPCLAPTTPCRIDRVDPPGRSKKHWPCPGDHYVYPVMNQRPVDCHCFEKQAGPECLSPGGFPPNPPCASYIENWG